MFSTFLSKDVPDKWIFRGKKSKKTNILKSFSIEQINLRFYILNSSTFTSYAPTQCTAEPVLQAGGTEGDESRAQGCYTLPGVRTNLRWP